MHTERPAGTAVRDVETTVVVPFRNGSAWLAALLDSLAAQSFPGVWEVIAVDNGSHDDARDVALRYGSRLNLKVVSAPNRANPAYARNAGVLASSGRKLLFIDADDQVAEDYVTAMSRAMDAHELVTSRVDSTSLNPEWVRDAHGPPWQEDGTGVLFGFLPSTGVNIGIGRALFDALGGFDEQFNGSEDVAFAWAAQLEGGRRFHFVKEAVYRYRYRDSCRGLFRQSANWGRDTVLLFRRFRRSGMPPRSARDAWNDWREAVRDRITAADPAARAAASVRLGYCVGRLHGTVRYRVWYP